jgi:hypothetical protein
MSEVRNQAHARAGLLLFHLCVRSYPKRAMRACRWRGHLAHVYIAELGHCTLAAMVATAGQAALMGVTMAV